MRRHLNYRLYIRMFTMQDTKWSYENVKDACNSKFVHPSYQRWVQMTGPLDNLQVSSPLKIHLLLDACRPSRNNVCPRQSQLLQQVFVSSPYHGWLHREMVTLDISGIVSISAIDFISMMTASVTALQFSNSRYFMSWYWYSVVCTNPFRARSIIEMQRIIFGFYLELHWQ